MKKLIPEPGFHFFPGMNRHENPIPYWNWFGFPTDFIAAEAIDQVLGRFLAGLVLAAIVKPART